MNSYRGWEVELPEKPGSLEHVESSFEADNRVFTKTPPPPACLTLLCGLPGSQDASWRVDPTRGPGIYLWVEF